MRKKSKYKPLPYRYNPIGLLEDNMLLPVFENGKYLTTLKATNHAAMYSLVRGQAVKTDLDSLIAMNNCIEALWRMGLGRDYTKDMDDGCNALKTVARRFAKEGRVTLYAAEIEALNYFMSLHDEMLNVITVKQFTDALNEIKRTVASGKVERIIGAATA